MKPQPLNSKNLLKAHRRRFRVIKPNRINSIARPGEIIAGKGSALINNQEVGHQWFKIASKPINVTMKYGMSDGFPFKTSNTITHPSTWLNIKEAASKIKSEISNLATKNKNLRYDIG